MSTLNTLLKKHFGKLDDATKERVRKYCVRLLFRKTSNRKFTQDIRELVEKCPQSFKDDLLWKGTLIKDLKLFTVYAKKRGLSYERALEHANRFGLKLSDAALLKYSSGIAIPKHVPAMSLESYNKMLESIAKEIDVFTKKFVYKKMHFIINSTNCEAQDIVNELITYALQAVSYMYPFIDSYAHAVNIAKQTVHQRGINTIKSNTTNKRQRMQSQKKGGHVEFTNQVIPVLQESKLKMMLGSEFNASNLSNGIMGNHRDLDLQIDVGNILERATGKKKVFIGLLLGEYDKNFTQYLFDKNAIPNDKTNQDLFDHKVNKSYMKHAIQYSDLKEERGRKILKGLRRQLCFYR